MASSLPSSSFQKATWDRTHSSSAQPSSPPSTPAHIKAPKRCGGLLVRISRDGHPEAYNPFDAQATAMTLPMAIPTSLNSGARYDPLLGLKPMQTRLLQEAFDRHLYEVPKEASNDAMNCTASSVPESLSPLARMLEEDRLQQAALLRQMGEHE